LEFCERFASDALAFSTRINSNQLPGPSNMTNSHYYEGPGQTSASTYTSEEIKMYTFMPTKEEEERSNKKRRI